MYYIWACSSQETYELCLNFNCPCQALAEGIKRVSFGTLDPYHMDKSSLRKTFMLFRVIFLNFWRASKIQALFEVGYRLFAQFFRSLGLYDVPPLNMKDMYALGMCVIITLINVV